MRVLFGGSALRAPAKKYRRAMKRRYVSAADEKARSSTTERFGQLANVVYGAHYGNTFCIGNSIAPLGMSTFSFLSLPYRR